jgi:hypothetical protein
MTIYTAYWSTISPPIMVVFGSVTFVFSAAEIILDHFYPNGQVRGGDTEQQEGMGDKGEGG